MTSNYKQKKELEQLSKGSLKRIDEYCANEIETRLKIYEDLFLRYSLVILKEIDQSFDRDKAFMFLGNWKTMKRKSFRFGNDEKQLEWLNDRLKFMEPFPEDFVKDLLESEKK